MVLSPSDYKVPKPGETMDPTDPRDFLSRWAGLAVVFTAIVFAWRYASNRGAPFIDRTLGSLTGGAASYSGTSGGDSILG